VTLVVKDDGSHQGVAISDTKELIAAHAVATADNPLRAKHGVVTLKEPTFRWWLGGTWDYSDYFVRTWT
jgi:hypothetical protein